MESYRKIVESNNLIITRHHDPVKDVMRWAVGRVFSNGDFESISYGDTIEESLINACNLIKGDENELA